MSDELYNVSCPSLPPSFLSVVPLLSSLTVSNLCLLACLPDCIILSLLPSLLPCLPACFLPCLLHCFLPSLLACLLPCFLPSLLPCFLPSLLPSFLSFFLDWLVVCLVACLLASFLSSIPSFLPSLLPTYISSCRPSFFHPTLLPSNQISFVFSSVYYQFTIILHCCFTSSNDCFPEDRLEFLFLIVINIHVNDLYFQEKMTNLPAQKWYNLSLYCHNSSLIVSPKRGTAIFWYSHFIDEQVAIYQHVCLSVCLLDYLSV